MLYIFTEQMSKSTPPAASTPPEATPVVRSMDGTLATLQTMDLQAGDAPAVGGAWPMPPRYADLGVIASGAMGTVRRVRDEHLQRTVAMKLIRVERLGDARVGDRFLAEARLTARLQHPGIVPVHDWGTLPDGQLWFTMKEVRGQTLGQVIRAVHRASPPTEWGQTDDGWRIRRLVSALIAAAQAVAYAHEEGVLHRDLKPANIMVGAFGEVQVMDWGVARSGWGSETGVTGTPAYMAPEQAAGETQRCGPWSDVYGLGAILYSVLAGRAPYAGQGRAGLAAVLAGPPESLQTLTQRPVPADLMHLCDAAMARTPTRRTQSAAELADQLQSWLDGARRQDRARLLVDEAQALAADAHAARLDADAHWQQARQALAQVIDAAPVADKVDGWALEDSARAAELRETELALKAEQTLQAALRQAPGMAGAREALADHYRDRLEQAETRGDTAGGVRFETLLRAYDTGRHAQWLAGDGVLDLVTDPPGVPARLWRLVEKNRQLQPVFERALGSTPLRNVAIGRGSWVVTLERPGCEPVRYPVHIGRGTAWRGIAPGTEETHPIWIPAPGDLAADEVYVPAGWFTAGGDADALDSLPRRRYWLDGFTLGRHAVTHRQYLAFINAVAHAQGEAAAQGFAPGRGLNTDRGNIPLYRRGESGSYALPDESVRFTGSLDSPVNRVDWFAATAYAAWAGRRLPHDLEWEKTARGVDERVLPWGSTLDPAFCAMQKSFADAPQLPTVHAFALDVSVYGTHGMGGLVREVCANGYERGGPDGPRIDLTASVQGPYRMSRGGCMAASAPFCRSAGRFAGVPESRMMLVGFRVARSVP